MTPDQIVSLHLNDDRRRTIKLAFLAALRGTHGQVAPAARAVAADRRTLYAWRKKDDDFAEAWDAVAEGAWEQTGYELLDDAIKKVMEGWLEPVFQNGGCVGYKRKFSEGLHRDLLKAFFPDKFNTQRVQPLGKDGEPADPAQGGNLRGLVLVPAEATSLEAWQAIADDAGDRQRLSREQMRAKLREVTRDGRDTQDAA